MTQRCPHQLPSAYLHILCKQSPPGSPLDDVHDVHASDGREPQVDQQLVVAAGQALRQQVTRGREEGRGGGGVREGRRG